MTSFTLDTNCIIAVDEGRPAAVPVLKLVDAHKQGLASVALVAISASERQRDGKPLETFTTFKERIERLGLGSLELIEPMMYFDISSSDFCLWADDESEVLEQKIHEILFPGIAFKWKDFCAGRGLDPNATAIDFKWLNAKCDVQAFWSHAHHGREVFVTSDENFHAEVKKASLIALAGGRIQRPEEAAAALGWENEFYVVIALSGQLQHIFQTSLLTCE